MDEQQIAGELRVPVRALQIIVAALSMGLGSFLVVALVISSSRDAAGDPLLTYLALAMSGAAIVARFVVPPLFVAAQRRRIAAGSWKPPQGGGRDMAVPFADDPDERMRDAGRLFFVYQTATIIGAALLEGAGFFSCIAFMLEGQMIALACVVLLMLGIAAHFPSAGRAAAWIAAQLRRMDEDRMMGR